MPSLPVLEKAMGLAADHTHPYLSSRGHASRWRIRLYLLQDDRGARVAICWRCLLACA